MEIVVPDEWKYLYVQNDQRPVVKIPAAVLRQKALEVEKMTKKTGLLVDGMLRIMKQANGVGLAAPQIGVLQRIIVIAPHGVKPQALINPVIVESAGEVEMEEGCLSIPGLYGNVTRPESVVVEAMDRRGREFTYELEGMPARVVQHEIDHLNGILFIDKAAPATLHWANPDRHLDENE